MGDDFIAYWTKYLFQKVLEGELEGEIEWERRGEVELPMKVKYRDVVIEREVSASNDIYSIQKLTGEEIYSEKELIDIMARW